MLGNFKHSKQMVVDLSENVLVFTTIRQENHPALRSGFAGYPANPRWNVNKFGAWKIGCQWRKALLQGQMIVRSTDSMLVSAAEQEQEDNLQHNSNIYQKFHFLLRTKWLLTYHQILRTHRVNTNSAT